MANRITPEEVVAAYKATGITMDTGAMIRDNGPDRYACCALGAVYVDRTKPTHEDLEHLLGDCGPVWEYIEDLTGSHDYIAGFWKGFDSRGKDDRPWYADGLENKTDARQGYGDGIDCYRAAKTYFDSKEAMPQP